MALRAAPAGLVALGLMLEGCGDREESPLGPAVTASAEPTGDAGLQADKQRNAVDLGPAMASARGVLGAFSVSAFGATTASIPFAPEPGPFANNSGLSCDDCVSVGLPIGFSFTYFGNTYTTFNISSNGFIQFPPSIDNGCCAGRTIPSVDGINNLIAAAWTDLYPGGGGGVFYETRGRAPNRYLIVAYQDVPWCCETGTSRVTAQIILYEGTNTIEIHTTNQSAGHTYTQGVEDASGTLAAFLPGRVAANYELANDGVRFTTVLGSWMARNPLPSARRGPAVAVANGLLYAIGGLNLADAALTSVVAYNPSTNAWSTKASLPAARRGGNGSAMISGKLYLAGGFDAARALTRTLYAYNVSTNTWSRRADMPVVSACGGSANIGGKLYVFTGCRLSSTGAQIATRSLHRYDPSSNQWSTLPSAPSMHLQPAVGVISGKLYVVGGNNGAGAQVRRLDVFDPATNSWSTKVGMPTARVAAAAALVGGRLHVIGGRNGQTYLKSVEAYDPATDSWSVRAAMPTARAGLGVGVISSLVYAVGGRHTTSALATNERYTP
jgi:N-acetylneuraminic acid mutarotase